MIYLFTTTVKTFYIKQGGKQIMKGKYLKKWMSVFLSTALAISSISGCGNSDKEPTDSTDKSANETTDTANKDTASDEASDVQDGDTPLIGSWIDLSYGIQVKIEKDGTFVVWNDEQTAKGTYTYENNYLVMTSKDVQNEEKGYVKLSDDHFALFTSDSMILDYTTDCFVRSSAADKYDPAKDFSRYNQAWTIASGPDQFVINNETYDANELYIILTEGNRILEAAIGAAADDHLVDFDVLALAGGVGVLGQVGVADGGFQLVQIDLNGLFVLGIRVGLKEHRLTLAAALEVAAGHIVHREDAVLGTGFDGHVADAQAVVHRQAGNARAGELHGFVQRTVHTDHADDVQDQVLAGDAGAELALEHELDGRGHLEPCHAGGHAGSHIGGADTGGEGTQCTIGAGVAVRTDHAVACGHDAFFRQQSVLNAHLAHIVEVKDIVFVGELAALLGLGGALDVLVGHKVVQHDGNVLFVEHTVKTGLFKLVDGNRGGDVVAQYDVQLCIDELASLDLVFSIGINPNEYNTHKIVHPMIIL